MGSYADKIRFRRWNDERAFPERKLYLNLLEESKKHEMKYDFSFLPEEQAKRETETREKYWFEIKEILNLEKPHLVNNYLIENGLFKFEGDKSNFANETLFRLHELYHRDTIINYYLEEGQDLEKVLNIFIRVNSGGTELSYSDLLLSIATAQWEKRDAREEIHSFVDRINNIGDGFRFSKDFILKSALVLSDFTDIAFKVGNFTKDKMQVIERKWDEISQVIHISVELVFSFGFTEKTLTSSNALIPIAYYLLNNYQGSHQINKYLTSSLFENDRDRVKKWLTVSLLKRTFSGNADNVLRWIRDVLQTYSNNDFPIKEIKKRLSGTNKSMKFDEEEIDNLLDVKYGGNYTFSVLSLLYPDLDYRNTFHQDHIFPRSLFTPAKLLSRGLNEEEHQFYSEKYNRLGNLQLLEGVPNKEKGASEFEDWLFDFFQTEDEKLLYRKKNYIPDGDLSFNNFKDFIVNREGLIKAKLLKIVT